VCVRVYVCTCVCAVACIHVSKQLEFVSVGMRATSGSIVCLKVEVVWKKMKMSGLSIDKLCSIK